MKVLDNADTVDKVFWALNLYKYGATPKEYWKDIISSIIEGFYVINTPKDLLQKINSAREKLYDLYITNIDAVVILKELMLKILTKEDDIKIKKQIVELTAKYEFRLCQGKRHILHLEAYLVEFVKIKQTNK
jgi:replication factor C subunit 3/5